ncbi:hypothetical protein Vadar_027003 [Vaccinium darrowii]|uniref:Uncharacterized protein n=1 Tax=Vaccinium darrowii TaxID=229202 RepID=A0ACB7XKF2_9ERIC|nr:hypothetical protein Vadar_027003 [Vaccinium darrowii]
MDTSNDDLLSSHEDDIDFSLQTPNNLDLNIEQECRSPNVAHFSSVQSNLSSKHEANSEGVLKIGMEFESDEHAYRFYNKYAGLVGFSIRKDWVNRSKVHGRIVSRKFTCSKEGYRRKDKRDVNVKKHRKETRTGCLAHMIITRQPDGRYRITHFEGNHNHDNVNPLSGQNLMEIPSVGALDDTGVTEADSSSDLDKQLKIAFQLSAIIEAIESVLPETKHGVCVWQMYRNALEHLTPITKDADSFAKDLRSCVFDHEDEEDFICAWDAMIEKFSLQKNEWLRWMFREKEKWAPVYGQNTFFIDVEKTHLGEILSNNLSNYLNPDLDVLQFFMHFESMVNEQRYKEFEADYQMSRCTPRLMANVVLLKHASSLYTPRAFQVFQREYEKCLNVVVNMCSENGSLFDYKANTFGKSREYTVAFNSSDDTVSCSCMKFEFVGFLCCHALKVLDHRNIKVVPAHCISKRWTRDASIENSKESCGTSSVEENPKLITASRYRELSQRILKISARASDSDKAFAFASKQLDEVMQGVEKILTLKPSEETQAVTSSSTGAYASESDQAEIFQDRNAIEGQDDSNTFRRTNEREMTVSDEDPLNNLMEKISNSQASQNVHAPQLDTITSISYQPAYVSSASSSLNPVSQGFYNFEATQVVECLYQPSNLSMDQQPNPHTYQQPSLFSNQHDSPKLLQESLFRNPFQEPTDSTQRNQWRQAMDLDVQHSHLASFIRYDQRYRESSGQHFVSK